MYDVGSYGAELVRGVGPQVPQAVAGGQDGRMNPATLTPDELLSTTRSVRKRLDLTRSVPRELVDECLALALQAPSGSNRQTWQFVVVTDEDLRRQIGDYYRACRAELHRWFRCCGKALRG
jgi:hypothetical protein